MVQLYSFVLLLAFSGSYGLAQFFNNRPYPTYSLESMPDTSFSCRDKILGGYYADPETQCQMFHVCVKVAGVGVQDFRFLCPNSTAFDQDAQICANWGDVDCEAATLYYSSDNFDLYRIGSGFETKQAAAEDEAAFHLQRADTGDLRLQKDRQVNQKSEYNIQNNYRQPQQKTGNSDRDIFRGSSSSSFFNNRGKDEDYENYDSTKNEVPKEQPKPLKKLIRRPTTTTTTTTTTTSTTTVPPPPPSTTLFVQPYQPTTYKPTGFKRTQYRQQTQNYYASSTTVRPTSTTNAISTDQYTTAINNYRARQQHRNYQQQSTVQQYNSRATNSRAGGARYSTNPQYDNQQSTQYNNNFVSSTTPQYNAYNQQKAQFSTPKPFEKYNTKITTLAPNYYNNQQQNIQNNNKYVANTTTSNNYYYPGNRNNYNSTQQYYSTESPNNNQYYTASSEKKITNQQTTFNTEQTQYNNYNKVTTTTTITPPKSTNNYYDNQYNTNNNNQYNTNQYNTNQYNTNQYDNNQYNQQFNVPTTSTTTLHPEHYDVPKQTTKNYQQKYSAADIYAPVKNQYQTTTRSPTTNNLDVTSPYYQNNFYNNTAVQNQYNNYNNNNFNNNYNYTTTTTTTSTQKYNYDYNDYGNYYNNNNKNNYEKATTYNPRSRQEDGESLKTAHSINFASNKNNYYNQFSTEKPSKFGESSPRPFSATVPTSSQKPTVFPTKKVTPSNAKNVAKNLSKDVAENDDKSYDYAYYDSNDSHLDYDNIGTEFHKTAPK